jgi:hypothetical protein
MAVKLIANYAKRLGLPGYSSHQFSVSIETELQNLDNVREQSASRPTPNRQSLQRYTRGITAFLTSAASVIIIRRRPSIGRKSRA